MKDKDAELREEIASHLEMATTDRIERGAPPIEAAAAARRELGNISQIQEATRDVWGRRWLEHLTQDVRYAMRTFRRNPAFAIVAILSLTLGIGANTALFEVVTAVKLRVLPVADPDRLVEVRLASMDGVRGNRHTRHSSVTQPIWREIQARQQAFSSLFAWSATNFNLAQGGEVRLTDGLWVTGDFFAALGLRPAAGRLLSAEDDRTGCTPRAILGYDFWRRAYASDPSAVGRTITLDSRQVEIIGVAPAGFHGLLVGRTFDVALPLCAEPLFSADGKGLVDAGTTWWLSVFGRLKPGWTIDRASAQLSTISPETFRSSLPSYYPPVSVQSYLDLKLAASPGGAGLSELREKYETPLWLLLGIAGLVLVIACANLANLLLARASTREREMAIRLGLGASRGRLIRQLLTESLMLVMIGAVLAMFVADTLGQWLVAALETSDNPITLPLGVDWIVLAFAATLALATCLLFGLAPAVRGTRVGAREVLHVGPRSATSSRESLGLRRALVVIQVALSLALLFGSLLFAGTLRNVLHVDPGFNPEGLLVANVSLSAVKTSTDHVKAAQDQVIERIRLVPGVESAAPVAVVPISGSSGSNEVWPEANRGGAFDSHINQAGQGFFATLGVPFLAGRDFDARDTPQSFPVAIVNDRFAAKLGGNAAAVGQRFVREATPRQPEKTFEIVGVVANSNYLTLTEVPSPVAFYAQGQGQPSTDAQLVVRSAIPAAATTTAITAALADLDPLLDVRYTVLSTMIRDTVVQERVLAELSSGFGLLAAVLTMVGLYGLVAYSVSRRTGEIGLRMALGATRRTIVGLVLRETGVMLATGLAVGVVLALAGGRAAATLLYGVKPHDPATLGISVTLLALIAVAASIIPARRATLIDPGIALRTE
jgi:putative ABC transport system permease protein